MLVGRSSCRKVARAKAYLINSLLLIIKQSPRDAFYISGASMRCCDVDGINRGGNPRTNGPVFAAARGARATTGPGRPQAQAAGARPGVNMRVLHRHIRPQDAGSIDLTYAKKQLGQGSF